MSTPTNHWKLGMFVVAALLAMIGAAVYFGTRSLPKETITFVSYFNEAVTGLENGSPVKFRGVTVGNVNNIMVAPDRRHVQVSYELESTAAKRLQLEKAATENSQLVSLPRAQLGSMGVTGVKYVSIDLFENAGPAEALGFTPPQHYIPTQPSTMKNIEDAVTDAAHRLPEITDQLVGILTRVNGLLGAVQDQRIPQRASETLAHVDQVLSSMQLKLDQFKSAELSNESRATLAQLQDTVGRVNRLLERVDGQSGVLANAERASLTMGDIARNASHVGSEAERTLREIGEAASAIRELADALERQPDMLIKGRAASSRTPQ
jgi:phospholipid/cholesterol/gamma-HCH transport system substrate-binding protein